MIFAPGDRHFAFGSGRFLWGGRILATCLRIVRRASTGGGFCAIEYDHATGLHHVIIGCGITRAPARTLVERR